MLEHNDHRAAVLPLLARESNTWQRARAWVAPGLALLAPALIYAALFGVYRPWNEDNAWYVSFSHNLCERSTSTDAVFGRVFPNGMGGTVAFGKLAAFAQCALLRPLGWTLQGAYAVSIAAFAASCGLLFLFVRGRGWPVARAAYLVAVIAIMEPFVAMANAAKYEFMILLLALLALVLQQRNRLCAAAFVATLAFESEPMGIVGILYLACAEFEVMSLRGASTKRMLWLALGAGAGVACILSLHPQLPSQLLQLRHANADGLRGHFLYPYFFEAKYFRHIPELCLILGVLGHRLLSRPRRLDFGLLASVAVFVVGLISYRANYHYAVFFLLPACLMVFEWLTSRWASARVYLVALLFMAPQYVMVLRLNGMYRDLSYIDHVRATVAAAVDPHVPVAMFGHYTSFFALAEHDFRVDELLLQPRKPSTPQEVLVCLVEATADLPPALSCDQLLTAFSGARLVGKVPYGKHMFRIFLRAADL